LIEVELFAEVDEVKVAKYAQLLLVILAVTVAEESFDEELLPMTAYFINFEFHSL
jgi:hypothetical protein